MWFFFYCMIVTADYQSSCSFPDFIVISQWIYSYTYSSHVSSSPLVLSSSSYFSFLWLLSLPPTINLFHHVDWFTLVAPNIQPDHLSGEWRGTVDRKVVGSRQGMSHYGLALSWGRENWQEKPQERIYFLPRTPNIVQLYLFTYTTKYRIQVYTLPYS